MTTGPHLSLHSAMDLIDGVADGQLELDYQPVVSMRTGQIEAVEALVRWRHPARGRLAPDTFLPQAQRSRLGGLVTTYVLGAAVAQWRAWCDQGISVCLAVNVPPDELCDLVVPHAVAELQADGFDPHALTIEVTERRIPDVRSLAPALEHLRDQGVRLSIDDFGTGDSTLTRLHHLRFEEIKIDRSFVDQVAEAGPGRQIVRFATELAHSLGMEVVAEGVERADQLRPLLELDVDRVQGFHVGRPMTAERLTPRLVRS
jgi:EAL domain-containing protein (putative c-di-GMP-specific phosphodiesterase class I)